VTSPTLSEHGNVGISLFPSDVADKAVEYLIDAGDRAAAAFSNREALALWPGARPVLRRR
jgi:hypothetical protein